MSKTQSSQENRRQILRDFKQELLGEMREEPPEVRRKVEENIWDLFADEEDDELKLSVTVELDDEGDWMARESYYTASAFGDSPADALREMATVIELYQDAQD